VPDYDGGTAFVRFVPSFRGAQAAVQAEVEKWARQVERTLQQGIDRGLRGGARGAGAQGGQAGAAYGTSFGETVKQRITAALRNLPNPRIDANSTPAERKIADLRAQLRTLQARVGVDLDSDEALRRIAVISGELRTLAASDPSVDIRVDASRALAQLEALQAEVDKIDGKNATVDVRLEGGWSQRVKAQIEGALQDLPEARIDVNTGQADTAIEAVRAQLESLSNQRIGIDIDAGRAMTELATIEAALETMAANDLRLDVRLDAAAALARLESIRAEVEALDGKDADIDVNVDRDGSARRGISGIMVAALALGPALIPILAALVPAFAGIGLAAVGAVAGIGVLVLAFSGVIAAVKAMSEARKNAAKESAAAARQEQQQAEQIRTAQQQLENAEASLANTRRQAADSAVAAADRVRKAQEDVLDAEDQAATAAEEAGRRVTDAQTAATRARESAAESAQRAARDVADAVKRQADAERDAGQAAEQASRRVEDARQNVADVTRASTQAVERALDRQADAERSLEMAQRRARDAQTALTQARKDAQEQLEDLSSRAANGLLDERDATFDLADKTATLAEVRKRLAAGESGFSQDDVDRALLKYDQAAQALKDIQLQNARTAAEQQAANEKGVDGADGVVSAEQAVADARYDAAQAATAAEQARADAQQAEADRTRAIGDATRDLTDALRDQDRVAVESAERRAAAELAVKDARVAQVRDARDSTRAIAEADRAVTDAAKAAEQSRIDGLKRIAKAQEGVAEARRAQDQQARSSAFAIAQAEQGVASASEAVRKASERSFASATTSADKLAQAMAGLSPAGQRFAHFIYDELRPALGGLRDAAQEGLLPGLTEGLEALLPFMPKIVPVVRDIAQALGALFSTGLKALTAPFWRDFFGWLAAILPTLIVDLGQSLGHLLTGLAGLLKGLAPLGFAFLDGVGGALEKFSNWSKQLDSDSSFKNFIGYLQQTMSIVTEALSSIAGAFGHLVQAIAPIGGVILFALGKIADFIHEIPIPMLTVIIGGFIAWAASIWAVNLAMSASPIALIVIALVLLASALVVAYKNIGWFHDAVDATWNGIKALWTSVLQPTIAAIGAAFVWLWENAVSPSLDFIGKAAQFYWDYYLKPAFDALSFAITKVVGPAFTWLWNNVVSPAMSGIASAVSVAWSAGSTGLKAVLGAIDSAVDVVGKGFGLAKTAASTAWTAISSLVSDAWTTAGTGLKAVLGAIDTAVDLVGKGFGLAKDAIQTAWNAVGTVVSNVWDDGKTGLSHIFSAIADALGADDDHGLRGAFNLAKTAISRIWNGLKKIFAAPIIFMVDTVLNKGLIGAFNWVAGKIPGAGKLAIDPITLPDAVYAKSDEHPGGSYATGGILPGYTPGRDVHRFYSPTAGALELSGGEPILRPEVGRVVGSKWVDGINGAAISGGVRGVQRFLGGFDKGGILGRIGDAASSVASTVGNVWDIATSPVDFLKDAFKSPLRQLDERLGNTMFAQLVKSIPAALVDQLVGAIKGAFGGGDGGGGGPVNPGLDSALDWARTQVGKPYVWGGVGPQGYDCSGFQSAIVNIAQGRDPYARRFATGTLPADLFASGPGAYEIGWFTGDPGHVAGTVNGVNVESRGGEGVVVGSRARGAHDDLFTHHGHLKGFASGGVLSFGEARSGDSAYDFLGARGKHRVPELADLLADAKLYDSGGYLSPGYTLAFNGTGAPEPVLTAGDFEHLAGAAEENATRRGGDFNYFAAEGRSSAEDEVVDALARGAFFGFGA